MAKNLFVQKPAAEELEGLDKKHYIHPTTNPKSHVQDGPKITFTEGNGIYVKDIYGDTYIDGVSMLWNVNLGHGQKELAEAANAQMSTLAYSSSFIGYSNEPAVRLAHKVTSIAPGDLNAVFFTSGGSESNDTAYKLSRFYWKLKGKPTKTKIISLKRGYHGVTVAAQTATGIDGFHNFSGSKAPDILHANPHLTECEQGDTNHPQYEGSIRSIIEREGPETIAAVIMEPVQGSGGVRIPPQDYLQAVRKLCNEFGILMIADEVITGFGRTGKMFGIENWNVVPDLMCIAKGITSGYSQLGGVLIKQDIRDTIVDYDDVLAHGFTYSGHPTACAVGLKNIEIFERDNIVGHTKEMENVLLKGFTYLEDKHEIVARSRSIGLLAGFELLADRDAGEPFKQSIRAAADVVEECFKRKLLLRPLDFEKEVNVVAIAPPLVINEKEIEEMISIIDESIIAFKKKLG